MKRCYGWHWVPKNRTTGYYKEVKQQVYPGYNFVALHRDGKRVGKPRICGPGVHCLRKITSHEFARHDGWLCKVLVTGSIHSIRRQNKVCGKNRKVLWMMYWPHFRRYICDRYWLILIEEMIKYYNIKLNKSKAQDFVRLHNKLSDNEILKYPGLGKFLNRVSRTVHFKRQMERDLLGV